MKFTARVIHHKAYSIVIVILSTWKHAGCLVTVYRSTESYLALVARLNWLSQIARPTAAPCAAALFWEAL